MMIEANYEQISTTKRAQHALNNPKRYTLSTHTSHSQHVTYRKTTRSLFSCVCIYSINQDHKSCVCQLTHNCACRDRFCTYIERIYVGIRNYRPINSIATAVAPHISTSSYARQPHRLVLNAHLNTPRAHRPDETPQP